MDPKELALKHFDKGVLALILAGLILVLVGHFSADTTSAVAGQIQQHLTAIDKKHKDQKKPAAVQLAFVEDASRQIKVDTVPQAAGFPAWTMHRRPYLLVKSGPPPPGAVPLHYPPVAVTVSSDRGRVTVRWEESDQNKFVEINGYEVLRRDSADGVWSRVGSVEAEVSEYVDTDVVASTDYWYKVVSVADVDHNHPRVRKAEKEGVVVKFKDPDDRVKESDVAGPVETPRDVYLIPTQVMVPDPITEPEKVKSAFVKVYRWDSSAGDWLKPKQFSVNLGDSIGQLQKGSTRRPARDYRTGAKLVDCGVFKKEVQIKGTEMTINKEFLSIEVEFEDGTRARFTNEEIPEEIRSVR